MASSEKISAKLLMAIFATGMMSFCGVVSETAMNVTFPTLMNDFKVDTSTVQWLTTGYLLMLALVVPLSSYLKRRFPMKGLFLVANLLFLGATFLCSLAPHFSLLLLGRLIQGVATGIALPLMFNIVLEQAPKQKIGLLMGVASLITAMAPALGPVLGGVVVDLYGWRVIFWLLAPVLFLSFLFGVSAIRQHSPLEQARLDYKSYLLLAAAFISFIFATEKAASHGWLSPMVLGLFALALVALGLFVRVSQRSQSPLIQLVIFKNAKFTFSLLYILCIQFCVLALGYLIPNYSQLVSGSSASLAGTLLLPGTLLGAICAPISGQLLDRFGAKKPILSGSLIIILALCAFSLFGQALTTGLFIGFYLCYALGQALSVGNTMTNGLRELGEQYSADGNAVINTLQQLSGAVGTAVASTFVAMGQQSYSDYAQGTMIGSQYALILLALLSMIAFGCVWRVFKQ